MFFLVSKKTVSLSQTVQTQTRLVNRQQTWGKKHVKYNGDTTYLIFFSLFLSFVFFFFYSRMASNSTLTLLTNTGASSKNGKTTVDIDAIMENITIVFYTMTILFGTTGNALVIWMSGFRLKSNVTNVWLVNLAVADLIFCLTRVVSLIKKLFYNYWPFGVFLCKFNGFFKYTNMFCSVFILAVISLDRALCVWRPVFTRHRRTLCAARLISVGVWIVAVIFSVPYYVYRQVYTGKNNLTKCSMEVKKNYFIYLQANSIVIRKMLYLSVLFTLVLWGLSEFNLKSLKKSLKMSAHLLV